MSASKLINMAIATCVRHTDLLLFTQRFDVDNGEVNSLLEHLDQNEVIQSFISWHVFN